ncbi:MAG: hypothetical protein QXK37_02580 [Candidatus Woesearchaeota archaeon]
MAYEYQYGTGSGGRFVEFFQNMENLGFVDALLPFLLIFTVVFAVLQKTNILGAGKKNFNVVIAAVIALLVVIPHVTGTYPPEKDIVAIMNNALPQVSIVLVAIVMALLIIGILGGEARWMGGSLSGWIAILAFLIIVYIFGGSAGWWEDLGYSLGLWDADTIAIVIIILVFAIVIWYITKSDSDADKASKGLALVKQFGDMFKKP